MRQRTGSRARLFVGVISSWAVASGWVATAHAQFYLHSPSEEAAATAAVEGLKSARVAHVAAIDDHKTYLATALQAERNAVMEREIALRDARLTVLIGEGAPDGASGVLGDSIAQDLDRVAGVGTADLAALGTLKLDFTSRQLERLRIRKEELAASRDSNIRLFELGGGAGEYCDDAGQGVIQETKPSRNGGAFALIRLRCGNLRQTVAQINNTVAVGVFPAGSSASRPLRAVAQALLTNELGNDLPQQSELAKALRQQRDMNNLSQAHKALTAELNKQLRALERYHACEQKRVMQPTGTQALSSLADDAHDFAEWLAKLDEQTLVMELADEAEVEAPQEESLTCEDGAQIIAKPPLPSSTKELAAQAKKTNADAAQYLTAANLRAALVAARELGVAGGFAAALQAEAQEFQSGKLHEVLAAIADPSPDAATTERAKITATLTRLLGRLEGISATLSGNVPDTSAVLVELAAAQLKLTNAKLETERLARVQRLANLRVEALRRLTFALLRARQAKDVAAVRAYADSWNEGRIPLAAIENDEISSRYTTWLERERAAIEAGYAVLEPAAAETLTYAKGGVTAADVAGYVQAATLLVIAGK